MQVYKNYLKFDIIMNIIGYNSYKSNKIAEIINI